MSPEERSLENTAATIIIFEIYLSQNIRNRRMLFDIPSIKSTSNNNHVVKKVDQVIIQGL